MVAEALVAIEKNEFELAFSILHEASFYYPLDEFLPFYAFAAARVGQTRRINEYLEAAIPAKKKTRQIASSSDGILFDEYLATAFLLAEQGEHQVALSNLKQANSDVLHTGLRSIFTRYQVIESSRLLFESTGVAEYRDFALDLARKNAIIDPSQAWTHSFIAMLSDDAEERTIALARVLHLDRNSRCLAQARDDELSRASEIATNGYPLPKQIATDRT